MRSLTPSLYVGVAGEESRPANKRNGSSESEVSKFLRSAALLLTALLAVCLAASATAAGPARRSPDRNDAGRGEGGTQEQALQKRVEEYYGFLQVGNSTRAESCVAEDSKEMFRANPKQTFPGFRVQSVHIESGGTTASAVVGVQHVIPGFPGPPVFMPQTSYWRLINGTWYLELPQQPAPPITPASTPGPEELKFKGHRYNLGMMQEGQVKIARFPFRNVADHVVTISDVITWCPCLKATLAKKEYKPGESGELAIAFDSAGYRLDYEQSIVVKTEPGDRKTYLLVFARVMPPRPPPKSKAESPKPSNP